MSQIAPTDEFDTEWTNYGDANPDVHGGRFIRWVPDNEMWKVVETMADEDPETGELYQDVFVYWLEPMDVWVDGDPSEGFTDAMESILESLHENGGLAAPSPEPNSPRFINKIGYYVVDLIHHIRVDRSHNQHDPDLDYSDVVAEYGVDSWD